MEEPTTGVPELAQVVEGTTFNPWPTETVPLTAHQANLDVFSITQAKPLQVLTVLAISLFVVYFQSVTEYDPRKHTEFNQQYLPCHSFPTC